ncbi:MAG: hypothetical protein WC697_04380 [Patescibacteria group bacterium]|jgi:hypothetical protein
MKWAIFLHFYQPSSQQLDILERIVNESYRKIISGLALNSKAKITINISAGLTELLAKNGYQDVIEQIKDFAKRGQIEFTGGVKYHPFLPLLPKKEIKRQILLNNETNKKYFGKYWQPKGFFSPELAYSEKVAKVVEECGFKWIIGEELASPQKPDFKKIYPIQKLNHLKIIFRDKRISNLILSAICRNFKSLISEIGDEIKKDRYLLTVMDSETFGHHRPGLENLLFEIYQDKKIEKVFVSELIKNFSINNEKIIPRDCTWSSEEQDFWLEKEKQHPFTLWQNPENPIHNHQWEFTYFVIDLVLKLDKSTANYKEIRDRLDKALSSDQYWWASAKPWWSLEMIEQSAFDLKKIVFLIPKISREIKEKAENYYRTIIDLAFEYQRSGLIRQAHRQAFKTVKLRPYKERVMAADFNSMVLEFEDEMNKAIKLKELEKAIKWRDAIFKLKNGMDIYDVLHVVDDLGTARLLPSLKGYWEYAPGEFSKFAKEYFENHKDKEFLAKQPQELFKLIKIAFEKRNKNTHPLGFSFDEYNNFYLCELPSIYIEYWLGEFGWDAMSLLRFSKFGNYHQKGQCDYQYKKGKLKIIIKSESLISYFLQLLKQSDFANGKYLKLALLAETNRWSPIFFKKNNSGQLFVEIPYKPSTEGFGFKFKISGYTSK